MSLAEPTTLTAPHAASPVLAVPPVARPTDAAPAWPEETPSPRRTPLARLTTTLALAVSLAVAGVFTGLNIFHFPHFESDEGTYVASAWSMFRDGQLSYYTYNYDHPPLGWALIGLWSTLSGGFLAFGSSIASGRALMWLVTLVSTVAVFRLVHRGTGRAVVALFSAVLFAASPLAVDLHRQVWLDNLATLWLLLSLVLLQGAAGRLGWVLASGLLFGVMFWTKEVFCIFLPGMLVLVALMSHPAQRRFATALWATTALSSISLFVLLATLKDELVPSGVLWSAPTPHVSLLGTYLWQIGRGGNGGLLSGDGDFRRFFAEWLDRDPLLMAGGLAAAACALLALRFGRDRFPAGVALLALSFLAFLARGGVVLYYYVIPLIALLAVATGLVVGVTVNAAHRVSWRPVGALVTALWLAATVTVGGAAAAVDYQSGTFTGHRTDAQREATRWMVDNLARDSIILMDSYAWVDLREPSVTGVPFANAHYYWPGVADPSIRSELLHDDWHTIDYIAFSPNIEADMARREMQLLPDALRNSDEVRTFLRDGWTVKLRRVRKLTERQAPADPILSRTWASYKTHFLRDGRTVDPGRDFATTSEGQSYALLRAVYMDDRATFDAVWGWTKDHLALESLPGLHAWLWGALPEAPERQGVLDANSATDAEEDMALALLFAARRWGEPSYQDDAGTILRGMWDHETAVVADRRVLLAGNWAHGGPGSVGDRPIVNPSYLAPYAYRIFAEADPQRPWLDLVNSSYDLLAQLRAAPALGGAVGSVPDWASLDPHDGRPLPAEALGDAASRFSYDASHLPWRLTLDLLWFKDDRAAQALAALDLPRRQLASGNWLAAGYNPDGSPAADNEALSIYAAGLGSLLIDASGRAVEGDDAALLHRTFVERILRHYEDADGEPHWGNPDDLAGQDWAWFATALMDGAVGNLWADQPVVHWDTALPR